MKILLAGLAAACFGMAAAEPLPALHADTREVTVSGASSGGYMAVQFHVAHSDFVTGAGAIAGGPYYCAKGSVWTAFYNCMTPHAWTPLPSIELLRAQTEALARAGRIDPPANLASDRAWLFSGTEDRTVSPEVVEALRRFYASYGTDVTLVADKPAGHAMVTEGAGNACSVTESPYINDCDYDAAGKLLEHLLGALAPPAQKESGRLLRFDQTPFGAQDISMDAAGYVFIPSICETERCRVHVVFHGCRQSADEVGERFVRDAGYNRWADTNRLIVLYPQTIARYGFTAFNPRACWDWWGYTGPGYATREGAQIRAIKAMLERIAQ